MSLYGHTHINIDSLKRWVDALSMDGIQNIDIHISMKYDMDFRIFEVDALIKSEGNSPILRVEYNPTGFEKIISDLVARVYGYRCSIAHAKGDVEEYIAIPSISKEKISAEIPLVKYLAYEVIRSCSEV